MRIRTLVKHQLRRFGLEVSRFNQPDSFSARRQRLLHRLGIDVVLDVGASDGGFALELRSGGYAGKIVSFEPLPVPFASLQNRANKDNGWEARPWGLGAESAQAEMHVTRDDKCSSLLLPLDRQTRAYEGSTPSGRASVTIKVLDDIFSAVVAADDQPFLKIDTQGYEMHVLRGAKQSLDSIKGMQIELSLVELYEGSAGYLELLQLAEASGFMLVGFEPVFSDSATDQLLQIDALFERL